MAERKIIWKPTRETIERANLTAYMAWLKQHKGLEFSDYGSLWKWSVEAIEPFWESLWDYFGILASRPYSAVLEGRQMPGAVWFPGARLNYAENLFKDYSGDELAMLYVAESGRLESITWQDFHDQTAAISASLRSLGVAAGDRVVAYLPNIPQAIIAMAACASLGAIWASCPPDFGERSVLDRFTQIEPKVLIAVNGYTWAGKFYDRSETLSRLRSALPTVEKTILVGESNPDPTCLDWNRLIEKNKGQPLVFEQVSFSHPLWILYSSGTTGLPKPIVHGHGGILLEHLKTIHLTFDLKPADRFFWFTSTGWMMWNLLAGGLLNKTPIILYDGSPGYPDLNRLWQIAGQTGMTYFGTGAAFIQACMKAGIHPGRDYDLSGVRALGSTGSPLPPDGFDWVYSHVNGELALESFSGGTDLCTGFIGGIRTQPIYAGELQGPSLGAKVQSFDESGQPVIGEVGELVLAEPMPSMPLFFWNDEGMARYRSSYFEMFPGIWRHGDWLEMKPDNGCIIYGRSDSTINRQGIRMGTSEIYQAVQSLPEILDSLVIDLELLGRESYMPLFVVLRPGAALDENLADRIKAKIRSDISPRHVPNEIFAIPEVPYTLSGKKMEVPIRRILLGQPMEKAINIDAMRNPETLDYFLDFAKRIAPPG